MKFPIIIILTFFGSNIILGQTADLLELSILDTLIVKRPNEESVRINVSIKRLSSWEDTLCIYRFYRYVPLVESLEDTSRLEFYNKIKTSLGLAYFIQNTQGDVINTYRVIMGLPVNSYEHDWDRERRTVTLVNENDLTLMWKELSEEDLNKFNAAKIVFNESDSILNMEVYPLLGKYHNKLSKGVYYLTLFYVYKRREPDENQLSLGNYYEGVLKSNRVKLIVEKSRRAKRK